MQPAKRAEVIVYLNSWIISIEKIVLSFCGLIGEIGDD